MLDGEDFVSIVRGYRDRLGCESSSNESELVAFTAYAQAFPDGFLALVDTYDTLQSGVPNFLCVALALDDLGHRYAAVIIHGQLLVVRVKLRGIGVQALEERSSSWCSLPML